MREALAARAGTRATYTATFVRFGLKPSPRGQPKTTLLFINVVDAQGASVTDHLWFKLSAAFARLGLRENDVVNFKARSMSYEKGYQGDRNETDFSGMETDYKLGFPTDVRIVHRGGVIPADSDHRCHAEGCTVPTPPRMLMCSVHWAIVPKAMQGAVWDHYRPGQEVDKRPSQEWHEAADAAIAFVAAKEGQRFTQAHRSLRRRMESAQADLFGGKPPQTHIEVKADHIADLIGSVLGEADPLAQNVHSGEGG